MRHLLTIAACATALAGVAGCGGGGDDQTATDPGQSAAAAAQSYVAARNSGDAAKICQLYSQKLINQLAASDCEDFVQEQTSGAKTNIELFSVHQSGDQATVTLGGSAESGKSEQLQIQLQLENGEWKITSLGPGGAGGV
jgi:ketosteroid isomerase-like protein